MNDIVLSFVTGTRNRREGFKRLANSIISRATVPWEFVVSDASDEPYPDKYPKNVIIIPERPRRGCVNGYNMAFNLTRGKYVIWFNDDAEMMPGCDSKAVEFMEAHPDCGIGAIYYAEKTLPYRVSEYKQMIYANFGIVPRSLGNQVRWFDDDLWMYGNDNSLCFRILLAGYGIGSIPAARIWHHSVTDKERIGNEKNQRRDAETLCRKYMPMLPQMLDTYRMHKNLVGPLFLDGE